MPFGLPRVLNPQDQLLLPTDVDWSLLAAKSIAVADADGREHHASHRELANIQENLRRLIDRRVYVTSARDFLFGATDLAFGVAILRPRLLHAHVGDCHGLEIADFRLDNKR